MKNIKLFLTLVAISISSACLFATEKTQKNQSKSEDEKVYIFGVGSSFGDTIVHFTSIIELDSIKLEKKNKFLPLRSVYSLQLKTYLEGKLGLSQQTCCVIFSKSKKKISKKYYKLKKAYLEDSGSVLKIIGEDEFRFKKTTIDNTKE